jgi:hypothetical protein
MRKDRQNRGVALRWAPTRVHRMGKSTLGEKKIKILAETLSKL